VEGGKDLPGSKSIIQRSRIDPQDNDEINPALGEEIAGVPVDYAASFLGLVFDSV
jgi:hypothetical protein